MIRKTAGDQSQSGKKRSNAVDPTKILDAAARVFKQKGYRDSSVEEIAQAAGVNKATVYYYFENKAQLLFQNVARNARLRIARSQEIVRDNPEPRRQLEMLIADYFNKYVEHYGLARLGRNERENLPAPLLKQYVELRDSYEAIVRGVIQNLVDRGECDITDANIASKYVLGLVRSVQDWYKPHGRLRLEEVVADVTAFILGGLRISDQCSVGSSDVEPNRSIALDGALVGVEDRALASVD